MKLGKKLSFLLIIVVLGCSKEKEFSRTQILMGDVPVSITIRSPSNDKERAFLEMEKVFLLAREIEGEVSEFVPESDISSLNSLAVNSSVPLRGHSEFLIRKSIQWSVKTGGAFDMTFASKSPHASFRDVSVDSTQAIAKIKREGVKIGVSGIAKGYILDQMSLKLRQSGFGVHQINAGGDLVARGQWKIGLKNPTRSGILCKIDIYDEAVATSGLYERGEHILDPRTKRKVQPLRFSSLTVFAPSALVADALATAAFVMSQQGSRNDFKQFKKFDIVAIDGHGKTTPLIGENRCQ